LGRLHDFADHSSAALDLRAHRRGVLIMMHSPAACQRGVTLSSLVRMWNQVRAHFAFERLVAPLPSRVV
jgi:hypothetical protein